MEKILITDILTDGFDLYAALDKDKLAQIGQDVIRDLEIDEKSRADWMASMEKFLKVAMQVKEVKNYPWPNASNVKYPLLTVGAIQFQHRAYPAIIDGSNLVKGRVLGPDPDGEKRKRADRIGQHMSWQLLFKMKGWEEDTDKLLLALPVVGSVFRKTYFDQIENANCSEMISPKHFVINYWAKSIEKAPRYTHILEYHPYEVQQLIAAGMWREVNIDNEEDAEAVVQFYEQHRLIDLDGDGYPEPYVVTTNKEGQVARIVPCYGVESVKVRSLIDGKVVNVRELLDNPEFIGPVVKIDKRKYFTKYGFIPAPDGSFYDIGFGWLLNDITASIDTILNQLIDAGNLENVGGGFVDSQAKIKSGESTFRPGEYKQIQLNGAKTLRDSLMPRPTSPPSATLFSLLGLLIEAAKEITSVQDIMTGQGTSNQPATTTLALIEQGQKVMTGIFKRIHRSFGEELRILRSLNSRYLDEQEYFNLNEADAVEIGRADYADDDLDIVPMSDPTSITDMQKMARAEAMMIFNGDPLVDQVELRRRYFEAVGTPDAEALLVKEQPQDPVLLAALAKEAREKELTGADIRAKDAQAANTLADAATKVAELGLIDDAASLVGAAIELGGEVNDDPEGSGGLQGMEPEPGNPEMDAILEGQEGGTGIPMVEGVTNDLPEPRASDDVGGVTGGDL
jgi:chaperonin GroES